MHRFFSLMSDFSDIVVVSSEEDTGGSDQSAAEVAAGNVVSVDDESESDCEIVSVDNAQEEKWRDVRGELCFSTIFAEFVASTAYIFCSLTVTVIFAFY